MVGRAQNAPGVASQNAPLPTRLLLTENMAGLYLHIPFCKQACHYCDFHFSTSLGLKSRLVEAIVREITLRRAYLGLEA